MGRPVMLGNGSLTVGLNEQGLVHDFYYPYVGLDNLSTSRSVDHKVGVWVDGIFSWIDDGNWNISVDFESDALVSDIHAKNDGLGVELIFKDFVDHEVNAFCRKVQVINHHSEYRSIRVFMHQVFQISRAGRADTALFVPKEHYILDYKGRCSLLIYGRLESGDEFDQFSIGNYGIEGKEGTYKDAEDGELSNNAVEHGGVDTVLRFPCNVAANSSTEIEYWIVAADSQLAAEKIHVQLKLDGLERRLDNIRKFWHDWLSIGADRLAKVDQQYITIAKKSLMVIKVHTDKRGGIIASCDSSIYNFGRDYYSYVWPRDGAYAIWPLIRLGYRDEPKKFFEFCRDIMNPEGYLAHKFQPDRSIGSTWHPLLHENYREELAIQEDETAGVLYMLGEYYDHSHDEDFVFGLYNTFIQPAANFLSEFLDEQTNLPHGSYDLWEEKFLTHTYTAALTYQALLVAADFADEFEYPDDAVKWRQAAGQILEGSKLFFDPDRQAFRKGFLLQEDGSLSFDNTLDVSSLYGAMMYAEEFGKAEIAATGTAIENILLNKSPSGGIPRYEHDNYFAQDPPYLGNPWFVTTLWFAQYYIRTGRVDKGRALVDWTASKVVPSGVLAEQVNPSSGEPIGVTPLVWSHAEFINTVLDLAKVSEKLAEQNK
ncbi:MAG: glycoside hydrolase family 15 protein [Candidatus Saccharimonadales bacterium]